jgi:zinc/manganese transport system substrate-binding protein
MARSAWRSLRRGLWDPARFLSALLSVVLLGAAPPGASVAQTSGPAPQASIVVTTAILGSIVRDLVGDTAEVTVLMESGVDPHAWAPSARETEAIFGADLVVANGLRLEEGLVDVLESAAAAGVPVFEATDHIAVRALEPGSVPGGSGDPHFWLDPLAMRDVVVALAPVLQRLGLDVADRAADLEGRLEELDAEVVAILAPIPPERRRLVTGHESMGYFADRYGFELVGAVVPGLSSQGEASARELAELADVVRSAGVGVIFAEVGAPSQIVDAIAGETGARVVGLSLEQLPPDGSYGSLIRDVASTIGEALSG